MGHLESHTFESSGEQAGGRDLATVHLHQSPSRFHRGRLESSRNEAREVGGLLYLTLHSPWTRVRGGEGII